MTKERSAESLFETPAKEEQALLAAKEVVPAPIPDLPESNTEGFLAKEIAAMRTSEISANDVNHPKTENIPTTTKPGELKVAYKD